MGRTRRFGDESVLSELLPDLSHLRVEGLGKRFLRTQFRGLQSSLMNAYFALHPFDSFHFRPRGDYVEQCLDSRLDLFDFCMEAGLEPSSPF